MTDDCLAPPLVLEVGEGGLFVLLILRGGGQVDVLELVLVSGVLRLDGDGGRRSIGESHPVSHGLVVRLVIILEGIWAGLKQCDLKFPD